MTENGHIFQKTTFSTGNLIEDFIADTRASESPRLFRKWAAISLIASYAQRRLWCDIGKGKLFPNQYILLVSQPGVGKSVVLSLVETLLRRNKTLFVGDSRTTIPGMLDTMLDAVCPVLMEGSSIPVNTHPLSVVPREYGTFMQAYDLSVLNVLNDFWDCPVEFSEMTRGKGKIILPYPVLNLISGTQPSFLNSVLPEEAWSLGFCSRLVLVYDWRDEKLKTRERLKIPPFPLEKYQAPLSALAKAQGPMTFTDDALDLFDAWCFDEEMQPVPRHPRLYSYVARRQVHWLKLAMVYALSEGSFTITKPHMESAKDALLEVEENMPEIFRDISKESDKAILDEVRLFILRQGSAKPIPERVLIQVLSTKIPVTKVNYMLETLITAGYLTETQAPPGRLTQLGVKGFRFFKPGPDINKSI